jgi:hypothetical protein
MAAATPEIALVQRLKGGATAAGARIYPEVNTPEPTYPLVIVTRTAAEGGARLSGKSRALKPWTIEVDHYGATKAERDALAAQTRALLAPDGAPWQDDASGVQGCFFQDSGEQSIPTDSGDTLRVLRETYQVWHFPT